MTASVYGAADRVRKTGDNMSGPLDSSSSITAGVVVLADRPVIMADASQANHFRITLGGNRVLDAPVNPVDGQKITLEVIQDGTGSRTLTFGAGFGFGTDLPGSSAALSSAPGKRDFLGFIYSAPTGLWYLAAACHGF